jgi:hypothetical protein
MARWLNFFINHSPDPLVFLSHIVGQVLLTSFSSCKVLTVEVRWWNYPSVSALTSLLLLGISLSSLLDPFQYDLVGTGTYKLREITWIYVAFSNRGSFCRGHVTMFARLIWCVPVNHLKFISPPRSLITRLTYIGVCIWEPCCLTSVLLWLCYTFLRRLKSRFVHFYSWFLDAWVATEWDPLFNIK